MSTYLDAASTGCPHQPVVMPTDGTPFRASPQFALWRAEAPATRLRADDGTVGWFVTGFDLARQVLQDPRFVQAPQRTPLGPSGTGGPMPDPAMIEAMMAGNVLGLDPPQHTRIRRAVMSRFSVRSVRGRLPAISGFVERRLDALRAAGDSADLFADFAEPVSVFAHCDVLGIPDDQVDRFTDVFTGTDLRVTDVIDFAGEMLERKRDDLGEDTLSDLLRSDLTHAERWGIATILMGSGRDAVAYMIGTVMVSLLTNPDQLQILRGDPTRIRPAVEEFVRFHAMFVSAHPRAVAEDVTLAGVDFRAGEAVWVSTVAANRDGERFADPDTFDVTRDSYGHLAFGFGVHTCIGQQLARTVITEAITQLLDRLPNLRLVEAEQLQPMPFAGDLPTYSPGAVRVTWA